LDSTKTTNHKTHSGRRTLEFKSLSESVSHLLLRGHSVTNILLETQRWN